MSKISNIQVISCGPGLKEINENHGVSSDWIQSMMKNRVSDIQVVRSYLEESPSFESNSAWIIMGSRYSAYDNMAWIDSLQSNILKAIKLEIPILGICFGHQILCKALGANVANNPAGWEIGSSEVFLSDKGLSSPIFKGFSPNFYVYQSHHDVVNGLPDNLDLLCSNKFGVQSVSYKNRVFGVQFHPEFSYDVMKAYFDIRTQDLADSDYSVLNKNDGNKVVDNFINIILKEN